MIIKKKIAIYAILFLIAMFPIKETCGGKGTCAMPPQNANEVARYHYDVKPALFVVLSSVLGISIPIKYTSGVTIQQKQ